jgi:hypothetical protein
MTTLLQSPIAGVDPFGQSRIDRHTYHSLPYEPSLQYHHRSSHYNPSQSDSQYTRLPYAPVPSRPVHFQPPYIYEPSQPSQPLEDLYQDDQDDMAFPSFGSYAENQDVDMKDETPNTNEQSQTSAAPLDSDGPTEVQDDHAVQVEPTQQVDYLAHEWREEDIWASWSYLTKRRKIVPNCVRLENASWRQWIKTKNSLKTVSPESLNWLKDCDVTWLYGPLQIGPKSVTTVTPPPSRLSHSSSFVSTKKPILNRKSASAIMLERSRSQHSLLQRAGEIIRIQQTSSPAGGRPAFRRHNSAFILPSETDSSVAPTPIDRDGTVFTGSRTPYSYSDTPTPAEVKHVLFDEEVKQVRAVESDEDIKQEPEDVIMESDEDDDGGLIMAPTRSRSKSNTPRNSFGAENKTIIPLPSTTLKYRTDTPEPVIPQQTGLWPRGRNISPSPSQATLRPTRPSHNFLLDDDAEISDEPWQPPSYDTAGQPGPGLRRTESGMFMPYDEDEGPPRNGIFGQALNAVNTFKDIAHVVWNVGWYKSTDNT